MQSGSWLEEEVTGGHVLVGAGLYLFFFFNYFKDEFLMIYR